MKSDDLISRSALEAKAKTIYMEFDNVAVPTRVISIADLYLAPTVDAEPVRHDGCALCDIRETGHGMIVYPDIRWISAINKQDGNYYMAFGHEGETARMQIAYCPVCGKKLEERDGEMKVIDCNKCTNCDKEHDRCKLYGPDPKKAVEMCASKNFGGYRPNGAKMDAEVSE